MAYTCLLNASNDGSVILLLLKISLYIHLKKITDIIIATQDTALHNCRAEIRC